MENLDLDINSFTLIYSSCENNDLKEIKTNLNKLSRSATTFELIQQHQQNFIKINSIEINNKRLLFDNENNSNAIEVLNEDKDNWSLFKNNLAFVSNNNDNHQSIQMTKHFFKLK